MSGHTYHPLKAEVDSSNLKEFDQDTQDRRFRRIRYYVLGGLLLLFVAVTAGVAGFMQGSRISKTGPVPAFPSAEKIFYATNKWMGDPKVADESWENMMPMGQGYILLENPSAYSLPPGMPTETPNQEIYALSVFHQLHCLAILRDTIHALQESREPEHSSNMHPDHCLDYLRQTLMCHGDTTIEFPHVSGTGENVTANVNGYGVTHQCKDWDAIIAFAEGKRATNSTGALIT
ncbi:MAG: hypothetical protein M4579_004243 [Chaenotheca gracillima]|nr:MAG: hypothetical protein M4579_004243 [Chaenotheca gracillima]